jgi:AraC-like DNA-binding protein
VTCPTFTIKTQADGEQAASSEGWSHNNYRLSPGKVSYEIETLRFSDNLFIEHKILHEGSGRITGKINDGRLSLLFFKIGNSKVLSHSFKEDLMSLSFSGSSWDATINAPAESFSLQTNSLVTETILPKENAELLKKKMSITGKYEALILPLNPEAQILLQALKQGIHLAKSNASEVETSEKLIWLEQDLIELTCVVLDQFLTSEPVFLPSGQLIKRKIAQNIEEMLWQDPADSEIELSLDALVDHFYYSRRQIQMAVEENFGIGFVALKRIIRLYQAHQKLKDKPKRVQIQQIARDYEFLNHGRFSGYYKEMFGIEPIKMTKNLK